MTDSEIELLIQLEINQAREQGCERFSVEKIEKKFLTLKREETDQKIKKYEEILDELQALPVSSKFPYREPSEFNAIKKARPGEPEKMPFSLSDDELYDRIYGAWLGRCAGCLLGKPVESFEKEKIKKILEYADAYPLANYFPFIPNLPEDLRYYASADTNQLLGGIEFMVRDDDIDYTVVGLITLEENGIDFSPDDVGHQWLSHLPYKLVYGAETVAYKNLINGIKPPQTACYRNPYRESIGAQIRADIWAYVSPGDPEKAAEFAYRDAALSHVKNGIYGEMFMAAAISAAFATANIEGIIQAALSAIPQNCRLAEAARDVITWSKESRNWEDTWKKIIEKYGHYNLFHTINNAAIVLSALLYGGGDFEKTITIGVMSGVDTDCNGATSGSIIGAALGAKKLPPKWIDPLNDRVKSIVAGEADNRISDLAKRTFKIAKKVLSS